MGFSNDLERERAEVMHLIQHASSSWAEAMKQHKMAPPDTGFAGRLEQLSAAASIEHQAWSRAHAAGLAWRPVPGAENSSPPYELRPGTGRRGPEAIWLRFDGAVGALNMAIAGSSAEAVSVAFGAVAEAAADLAGAIKREDALSATARDLARARATSAA